MVLGRSDLLVFSETLASEILWTHVPGRFGSIHSMNIAAIEQSADFGQRALPAIFGLQNEAFERFQTLTHLNLDALKAMMEQGQAVLSSMPFGRAPSTDAGGLPQQFLEHAQTYAEQVRQIVMRSQGMMQEAIEHAAGVRRPGNAVSDVA
ncbi:phasin family protein [Paraburkholderia sp. NMBU_R16]|uniref:phasin family protein n=1 Tax=Paraburkholderia sp. NMBU_R16 TaxID=2698676 RepID=UPI00349F0902